MTPTKTTKKPAAKPVEEKVIAAPAQAVAVAESADDMLDDDLAHELAMSIKEAAGKDRFFEAVGRRKTAAARVRLYTKGDKEFLVNDKPYTEYFALKADQEQAVASMKKMKALDMFRISVIVRGGGHTAQAEAIRHGTARVLVEFNQNFRKRLRKAGFLTRDPRERERKKFGLKRARKGPQWAKR